MKNNYLRGFFGALIGGIICTIPWILMYVYLNFMFSLLGAIIGFGAFYGYKLFGGKVTKKTGLIVGITSIVSITVATFVIIPLLLLAKEGLGMSWYYFNYLYTNGDFISAIVIDYIVAVVFTFLGISGVLANINRQGAVNESKESGDLTFVDIDRLSYDDKIKYLESVYAKYGAFSKETAVSEFKIMKELNVPNKFMFMQRMEKAGIVVAPWIKSYFDKEAVNNPEKAKKNVKKSIWSGVIVGVGIVIVATIISIIGGAYLNNTPTEETIQIKTFTFEEVNIDLPTTFKEVPATDPQSGYIRYLNHGDGVVNQVMIQKEQIPENSDKKLMKDLYIENIKTTLTVISERNIKVDGYEGFCLDLEYDANHGQENYRTYVAFTDTHLAVIMFYTRIDNSSIASSESILDNFKNETDEYISTVKLN